MRGALLLLLAGGAFSECDGNQVTPERAAQQFVDDLSIKLEGKPHCAQIDTDRDGYVTCTIHHADGPLESIQCAAVGANASGCKLTPVKVRTP